MVLLSPVQWQAIQILQEAIGQMRWLTRCDDRVDHRWRQIAQPQQSLVALGRASEPGSQFVEGKLWLGECERFCPMGIVEQDDQLRVGLRLLGRIRQSDSKLGIIAVGSASLLE